MILMSRNLYDRLYGDTVSAHEFTYRIFRGWPVEAITLFHSQPSGSIFFRSEVAREIDTWTNWEKSPPFTRLEAPGSD